MIVSIIMATVLLCGLVCAQSEESTVAESIAPSLSVKFNEISWEVLFTNSGKEKIQYILNPKTGCPRNFGIEFWDQEKTNGRRVYIGDYATNNRDGFGMSVKYLDPGKSVKFRMNFLDVSANDGENLKLWREFTQSSYCYCRVFLKTYASPMWPVVFNGGKTRIIGRK